MLAYGAPNERSSSATRRASRRHRRARRGERARTAEVRVRRPRARVGRQRLAPFGRCGACCLRTYAGGRKPGSGLPCSTRAAGTAGCSSGAITIALFPVTSGSAWRVHPIQSASSLLCARRRPRYRLACNASTCSLRGNPATHQRETPVRPLRPALARHRCERARTGCPVPGPPRRARSRCPSPGRP